MDSLPRPRNLRSLMIAGLLFPILFAACLSPAEGAAKPASPGHEWAEALRALDPANVSTPAHDITAVYLRKQDDHLQIRVDLLDFKNRNAISVEIRIADKAASQDALLIIKIPSQTDMHRIILDPLLDTVIIHLPLSDLPSNPRVDVSTPEDEITGLAPDGPVPGSTASLLLTFYDAFAGRFPAEALRSWDGAHSGPRGERHGLKHLLDAVEGHRVPVVLLDLKRPENLSALDAMGVLPRIKQMQEEGLLILPANETLPGGVPSPPELADRGRISGKHFGLPTSNLSFMESGSFQFDFLEDTIHFYRPLFSNTTYLPIAAEVDSTQPTPDGPSLEVRHALLEIALNADDKDLLVLGGILQNTTWGSPEMVGATLAYFASRPYIRVLTEDELMSFPTKSGKPQFRLAPIDKLVNELGTQYRNLTQPVLEFVKNWDNSSISNCEKDIDNDRKLECILVNDNYLAILDPKGARLTYLFAREGENPHQLIGPSWQVAVGLSDSSKWDLSASEAADPGAYPGAFADADDPFKAYEVTLEGNTLVFASLDGTRTKTVGISDNGLEMRYQTQESVTAQIPLLVDPWTRFVPGWAERYMQENTPGGVTWGLENGPKLRIQAKGSIKMRAFNEALDLLAGSEDPDFEYPPGHSIPFPMAIAEVEVQDGYFLRLERLP